MKDNRHNLIFGNVVSHFGVNQINPFSPKNMLDIQFFLSKSSLVTKRSFMYSQILPNDICKKYIETTKENLHIDIGAQRVNVFTY